MESSVKTGGKWGLTLGEAIYIEIALVRSSFKFLKETNDYAFQASYLGGNQGRKTSAGDVAHPCGSDGGRLAIRK